MGCFYDLLTFVEYFNLVNWEMEGGYCYCGFKGITFLFSDFST